jgi:plasmid stabilization system protein ParE
LPGVADVRFSKRALASLTSQEDYLRQRNPNVADAVLLEISNLASLIGTFPEMGRSIDGTSLRYHVTRKYRYRIIYRITAKAVEIRDILHRRQS